MHKLEAYKCLDSEKLSFTNKLNTNTFQSAHLRQPLKYKRYFRTIKFWLIFTRTSIASVRFNKRIYDCTNRNPD